ncbi:MAG: hypothetical protein ICV70_08185 [Jiangellaceae bacterium]|nr:hypothetical protein [Jiangellaceae bacterium]
MTKAHVTYDPILHIQELSRFRVVNPPASPRIGTALVLEACTGMPVVVWPGQRVPQARLGNYLRSYLVNIEHYALRLGETVPSKDPAFPFRCVVTFHCGVNDPGVVAHRGIRDVTAAMRLPLVRIVRGVARGFDIHHLNDAEVAIDRALRGYHGDEAIRVDDYLVELFGHAEYNSVTRNLRLDDRRRTAMVPVIADGDPALRAEYLANGDGNPGDLIQLDAQSSLARSDQALAAMRIQAGMDNEDFDTHQARHHLLGQVLGDRDLLGKRALEQPGARRQRIAGELEGGVVDGGTDGNGRRQSRVRWKADRIDEPVRDEAAQPRTDHDAARPQAGRVQEGHASDSAARPARATRRDPDADEG